MRREDSFLHKWARCEGLAPLQAKYVVKNRPGLTETVARHSGRFAADPAITPVLG
jgi:hypothetical protein